MLQSNFQSFCNDMQVTQTKMLSILSLATIPQQIESTFDGDTYTYEVGYTLDGKEWHTKTVDANLIVN